MLRLLLRAIVAISLLSVSMVPGLSVRGQTAAGTAVAASTVSTFFGDLAGFTSAAGPPSSTITFDDIAPGTDVTGTTISGVRFDLGAPSLPSAPLIVVRGADTFTNAAEFANVSTTAAASNKLFPTSGANVLSPGGTALVAGPALGQRDDLRMTFNPPVASVGFDLLLQSIDFASLASLTVLGPSGELLYSLPVNLSTNQTGIPTGSTSQGGGPGGAVFVGIVSPSANISAVIINDFDDNNINADSNFGYDTIRVSGSATPSADVSISQAASPDPAILGSNLTYTLAVTNNGPSNATGVTVTDQLPAGVTFASISPSQGTCTGTTTVICNLGTLANGATATVSIVVTATSAGTITDTGSVKADQPDPNPTSNTTTVTTTVTKKPRLDYFALGDSIASGHGLIDDGSTCRRSPRAYPYTVAGLLANRYKTVNFPADHFRACSGATTANPGQLKDPNLWFDNQVNYVLGHLSGDPTLVTITIGADDLHFSDPVNLLHHLFYFPYNDSLTFLRWLDTTTSGVSASLRQNVGRLLVHENVVVILTDYPNPMNSSSILFLASNTGFGSCVDLLLTVGDCYDRTETAVHGLNSAIVADAYVQMGRPQRLDVASIHNQFHGHESPGPVCGASAPAIADTWIQYLGDPNSNALLTGWLARITGLASGDCFHPNQIGANQYATAINERAITHGR